MQHEDAEGSTSYSELSPLPISESGFSSVASEEVYDSFEELLARIISPVQELYNNLKQFKLASHNQRRSVKSELLMLFEFIRGIDTSLPISVRQYLLKIYNDFYHDDTYESSDKMMEIIVKLKGANNYE